MTVVDASVLVSVLLPGDLRHAASRRWLRAYTAGPETLFAPSLLLVEVAGAMARITGDSARGQRAWTELMRMPGLRVVQIDRGLTLIAARLAANLRLRGADAVYVAVAYRLGVPLVTWDREQLDRAGAVIAAREP